MKHSELEESTRQALPQGNQSKPAMQKAHKKPADAIALLKADHKEVSGLLKQYESADGNDEKEVLARQICEALTVHAQVEEEIFYPAMLEALKDEFVVAEAEEEHHVVHVLIEELRGMEKPDVHFDAKFTVLAENVKHHIEEEEKEMLSKAGKAGKVLLDQLGEQMLERKEALMREMKSGMKARASA